MKKQFTEPVIQRIELNLSENIASSQTDVISYIFLSSMKGGCTIQNTNYSMVDVLLFDVPESELSGCAVYSNAKLGGSGIELVPRSKLFK